MGAQGQGGRAWCPVWTGLSAWAVVLAVLHRHLLSSTWGYTETGTELLVRGSTDGGLALYSHHPELQIGPLTFAAGLVVLAFPSVVRSPVLWAAMTAAGVASVAAVTRLGRLARGRVPVSRWTVAVGGAAVLAAWSVLAIPGGHLDDVLALGFAVAAVAARRHGRWDVTALLVAAAVGAKPWAVAFVPLLVVGHRPALRQLRTLGVFVAAVAAVWAPFLLVRHAVAALSGLRIPNAADSALRVLGYGGAATPPWDRPAEFVGGITVGLLAVARGRTGGVLLVGLGVRLLLDPGTHTYYTAGLLLAALMFDVTCTSWTVPWATLAGFVLLFIPHLVLAEPEFAAVRGWLRTGCTAGSVLLVTAAPSSLLHRPRGRRTGPPGRRPGPPGGRLTRPAVRAAPST